MSSALRSIAKQSRSVSRSIAVAPTIAATRAFHSPFALLSNEAPLTSSPTPTSDITSVYEKQETYNNVYSPAGQSVYVVSEPDPRFSPYDVPYGAFPTSVPYVSYTATEAPRPGRRASTSSSFAHPWTTRYVARNAEGVSFWEAQGGSNGGFGELPSRNPQPDAPGVAEKFSKLGVDNAWKARK